ncbi:Transcriptional regulator containing PAS, AAA-type ATPase, and DNA-binding Fis domains [Desulfatibacillum alkenivorans DSM 16219]|jgi:transcriptional regulator with PAS, ATPase and Fis domain|uniref:Transcriptional regulator containing PAS, AAA-type ATPase, and DNA-binding Fis domains n=1 Tax=Desulfatibacillum alkenivorans DSM 16219 TaxID=1121393 RepID=A0A1M6NFW1_9BACT|nr:sigma 54-interacting transcriptional regulator [Desulfatibacillum alkenivorans]SHJ94648.1 Transcriptional regulator containing PAS, AAA-type ATPase, and DNA-binding Fis domains [Desulfatibacillum alkenivorans DSM 16219]
MSQSRKKSAAPQKIPQDLLDALLNNPYEGLILVDDQGIIRHMSSANEGIYPFTPQESVGRHIHDVSPKSRMDRTIRTGKAEIGRSMILDDKTRVVARFPLSKDGKVIGAAGKLLFMDPGKMKELYERITHLERRLEKYEDELAQIYRTNYSLDSILGDSPDIIRAKRLAEQAAGADSPVLIMGESGTGKELFAHAIHGLSQRDSGALVKVNCAAIPGELLEAELFGYEEGAFTGARKKGKAGKFELAHGGTIFLDEIGDMPLPMQIKILRVLQEREVERVGANRPKKIDFRLICATNRDLARLMRQGLFRQDLYYRINVMTLKLPPLRDCRDDIFPLFQHFSRILGREKTPPKILPGVKEILEKYSWPGNVRELRNVTERALIVCRDNAVSPADLPDLSQQEVLPQVIEEKASLKALMDQAEKKIIEQALVQASSRAGAARNLGIHRTGLYQKMKKHGIE